MKHSNFPMKNDKCPMKNDNSPMKNDNFPYSYFDIPRGYRCHLDLRIGKMASWSRAWRRPWPCLGENGPASQRQAASGHEKLVGGDWNMTGIFPYTGNVVIPIDELIFFRGVDLPTIQKNYEGPLWFCFLMVFWNVFMFLMFLFHVSSDFILFARFFWFSCGVQIVTLFKIPNLLPPK